MKGSTTDQVSFPMTHRGYLEYADIPREFLKSLETSRVGVPAAHLFSTVGLALLTPLLYRVFPSWVTWIVCVLLTIRVLNCFSQLVHASNHGDLFPDARLNRWAGNVCAYFLGFTRSGHAASHHSHHVHLNTHLDPDRAFLGVPDPRFESVSGMLRKILLDLAGVSAIRRLLQYQQPTARGFEPRPWRSLDRAFWVRAARMQLPVAAVQGLLLAYYWASVGPFLYLAIYILPLFTLYTAQSRLRFFVEHSLEPGYTPPTPEDVWITRSTRASWLERLLVAPLGMPFHFEHHLLPSVPYYHLRRLHEHLRQRNVHVPVADGYFRFLWNRLKLEVPAQGERSSAPAASLTPDPRPCSREVGVGAPEQP